MKKTYKFSKKYILKTVISYVVVMLLLASFYFNWGFTEQNTDSVFVTIMIVLTFLVMLSEVKSNSEYYLETSPFKLKHQTLFYILVIPKKREQVSEWSEIYNVRFFKKFFFFPRLMIFSSTNVFEIKLDGFEKADAKELLEGIIEETKDNEQISIDEKVLKYIEEKLN